MIEKKSIVDQIEITRDGSIQIRIALLLVEDGVELDSKWHRTRVEPGASVEDQMAAVNQHLVSMGKAPVDTAALLPVKRVAALIQTPDVVQAYVEKMEIAASDEATISTRPTSVFSSK